MTIQNRAVEAELSIGNWDGQKKDRNVTRKVENDYQSTNSGKWVKHLIAEEAVKKITKFEAKVRKFFYDNTLPWGKGRGLLPTEPIEHYENFQRKMQEFKDEYLNVYKPEFVANYPGLKEEAKGNLNGMYDERDYPDADKIESKFYFAIRYFPVPEAEHFRLNLSNEIMETLRSQITEEVEDRFASAKRSLWEKMHKEVSHMVEKLEPPDAIFRDTLVGNIRQLVESLRSLNVDQDAEIEAMRQRIEEKLAVVNPEDLRPRNRKLVWGGISEEDSKKLRAEVAREARTIAGEIGRRLNLED